MSFQVILGVNESETKKITKTITNKTTYDVVLRDECDILSPVIRLNEAMANVAGKNYMEIPAWNRKYFITDIKSVRDNLVEISAKVDVLSTYDEQIRASKGVVTRSQSANLYIPDSQRVTDIRKAVSIVASSNGFTDQTLVLVTAGH